MKMLPKKLIIGIIVVLAFVGFLYYSGFSSHLSLENIKSNAAYLKSNVEEHYMRSVCVFLAISIVLISFTLPVTAPMGVIGGFLFGLWAGVLYCMIAALVGTAVSFLVVRYALSHIVRNQYGKQLTSFNERMKVYGYTYLITLQLLTVVPYFVINTLAALAGVSFLTFMWTTALGSFPIIAIYAFAGRQLYMIHSWQDILTKEMLLLLILLAGLALLPMLIRKIRGSDSNKSDLNDHEPYDPEGLL